MANVVVDHIVKAIKLEYTDIEVNNPRIIAGYVMYKYKCSPYLAKQIAKQLTDVYSKTS